MNAIIFSFLTLVLLTANIVGLILCLGIELIDFWRDKHD